MTQSIKVSTNSTLKQARAKAQKDGLSLTSVIEIFLRDYVNGYLNVETQKTKLTENGLTSEQEDEILKMSDEAKKNKNVEVFDSFEDFMKELETITANDEN